MTLKAVVRELRLPSIPGRGHARFHGAGGDQDLGDIDTAPAEPFPSPLLDAADHGFVVRQGQR